MTKEIDAAAEAMKEQISKMMKNFKLPDVDMTALVEGQRKNIDAMARVAQLTTEGATAISQRQLEIFRVTSENLSIGKPVRNVSRYEADGRGARRNRQEGV